MKSKEPDAMPFSGREAHFLLFSYLGDELGLADSYDVKKIGWMEEERLERWVRVIVIPATSLATTTRKSSR